MAEIPVPFLNPVTAQDVIEIAEEEENLRKSELEKQINASDGELDTALVRAVERGKIALYPVGNTVQIRHESGD